MGSRETTHVLEIETGIGEPAFVPLSLGEELAPISVGRKGMWRIESARVLDVHAFMYFDGEVAFIQSADERAPALVDGRVVGQAWTELAAGSRIEIGQARLRFRSLLAPLDDTGETQAFDRNAARLPPPTPSAADVIPPKPERPFRPGEFAPPLDESTRIQPVESAVRNIPEAARASHPGFVQGPDAAPISVPPISSHPLMSSGMGPALQPMSAPYPGQAVPLTPPGASPVTGMHYTTGGYPVGMVPPGSAPPPYGPGSVPPHASYPPPVVPGPPGPPAGDGEKGLAAKWKEMPLPRRQLNLMSPLFLVSAYYTFFDDPPPPPRTARAGKDAGAAVVASARPTVTTSATALPTTPPRIAEPTPVPGSAAPVATAPVATAAVATAPVATAPVATAPVATAPVATAPVAAAAPAGKTYERLAIDAYLAGDYATSARVYAQLAEQTQPPSNIVYQEAARIIRAKLDAGAPR